MKYELLKYEHLKYELLKYELLKNELLKYELLKYELLKYEFLKYELLKNKLLKFDLLWYTHIGRDIRQAMSERVGQESPSIFSFNDLYYPWTLKILCALSMDSRSSSSKFKRFKVFTISGFGR